MSALRMMAALLSAFCLTSCASYRYNVPPTNPSPTPGKSNPVITWAQPAPVTENTPLSSTQLDATANVVGTFAYTPAVGTVLAPGSHTLSAVFTPLDTADYNSVTATVGLFVAGDSGPAVQTSVAVADSGNGRILIFKSPLYTGMSASIVLGQPGFTSEPTSSSIAADSLNRPMGLGMDAEGNLYAADWDAERVMRFSPPFANGMNASLELGQSNFTSDNVTADNNLDNPLGVTVDPEGNIWIADTGKGRVLEYATPIQQGMSPSLVIGHADLNATGDCDGGEDAGQPGSHTDTANATVLCTPGAVAFDRSGNLWVSDGGNGRILEFVPPFSNGMAATLELGYPASVGMNSPTPWAQGYQCPSATSAISPMYCGLSPAKFDASGNLWALTGDGGIVEFVPPFKSGMSPSVVLGPTQPGQLGLGDFNFDPSGTLIVADGVSRVLIFTPPFTSLMNPTIILGAADMKSAAMHCGGSGGAPSASTFCHPDGVLVF